VKAKVTYTIAAMKDEITATDVVEVEDCTDDSLITSMVVWIMNIDPRFKLKRIISVVYQ
jgi:hypothetical protein